MTWCLHLFRRGCGVHPVCAALAAAILLLPGVAAAKDGPALWLVGDEDTKIYLFGTVHILRPSVDWQRDRVTEAFDAADVVYLETDISTKAQAALQPLIVELGFNRDGAKLSAQLSSDGNDRLARVARGIGLSPAVLEPMRPWLAGVTIGVYMVVAQGGDPQAGVEQVLMARAAAAGKTMRYFETPEEQIKAIASPSDAASAESLELSLKQIEEVPDLFDRLVALWLAGNTKELAALMNGGMEPGGEVFEAMLGKRNRAWVKELVRVLKEEEGSAFVAVGALHLVGKDSVRDLLARKGYKVVRQ